MSKTKKAVWASKDDAAYLILAVAGLFSIGATYYLGNLLSQVVPQPALSEYMSKGTLSTEGSEILNQWNTYYTIGASAFTFVVSLIFFVIAYAVLKQLKLPATPARFKAAVAVYTVLFAAFAAFSFIYPVSPDLNLSGIIDLALFVWASLSFVIAWAFAGALDQSKRNR